jgi:nucleoside-diphosphate-sugar epimerase
MAELIDRENQKPRQIIVSGATGFVGQHLIPLLLNNNYQVIAIGRDSKKANQFDWFKDIQFVEHDFHKENTQIKFDRGAGLIHLAWQGLPNYKSLFHIEENLPFSYRFGRSLVLSGVHQVLVTGTCLEYGFQSGQIASNMEPQPSNPYALGKDSLRQQLESLSKDHPFCFQWARLFYMYGKGQNSNSVLSQLDIAIDNKESIFNMSGGEQLRDYLPIEDVVKQMFELYEYTRSGTFNICSGNPISIQSLVEGRIKERGSNIKLNLGYYPYTDYEPMEFWGKRDIGETIFLPSLPNAPLRSKSASQTLAPIRLRYNHDLSFIENEAFDQNLIDYSKDYENSQVNSAKFKSHILGVLALLKHQLPRGSCMVEVGCGKGDFVEMVEADGYFNVKGFDASYDGKNKLIERRYLNRKDRFRADILVLRHVLEHIPQPYDFLSMLKEVFGKAKIYIEVPSYDWIVSNKTFFDITYEHVNYFSQHALKNLFEKNAAMHGLLFDDQYQYVISDVSTLDPVFDSLYKSNNWKYISFGDIFPNVLSDMLRFDRMAIGRSVFLWGAATKGCLFLAHCSNQKLLLDKVCFAIDQNPRKIGKYLPVSYVEIRSKQDLFDMAKPDDILIISNPVYKDEIAEELKIAGLGGIEIVTL